MTPPAHPAPSHWFDSRVRVVVRVRLGLCGRLKMIILAFLGHPWTSIFRSCGGLGRPFWMSGSALGRVWRAVVTKDRFPKLASHHLKRFRSPKGAQKASNMDLKPLKKRFKNLSKFWSDFEAVSGPCFVKFGSVFGMLDTQT